MKALLLAAGRGERMRPLTDSVPKPLLEVAGEPLIGHHLRRMAEAGIREVVINLSWLAPMIRDVIGDGSQYGIAIEYSDEGPDALETAGAVVHARALLGNEPFLMVNADLWTDFPVASLSLPAGRLAHLVLVPNPEHNPKGDFVLDGDSTVRGHRAAPTRAAPTRAAPTRAAPTRAAPTRAAPTRAAPTLTFAGIGVYDPSLFDGLAPGKTPLAPLLYAAADDGRVSGERYDGMWIDIGTPERLAKLQEVVHE